jgi:hypothetical protein
MNCRGQSYDNAVNMSGLQARFKELNKYVLYVPCAGHSINLVGVQAVHCNLNVTIYFDFVQNLHNFFSSSTHHWEILVSHLGPHLKVVKHLSNTRWSVHVDAVTTLNDGYEEMKKKSLDVLLHDINQLSETHLTVQSSRKKMDELETTFLTVFWNDILICINSVSKVLQKQNMNLSVAVLYDHQILEIKTKAMGIQGNYRRRVKIVINNKIVEQVPTFLHYLGRKFLIK